MNACNEENDEDWDNAVTPGHTDTTRLTALTKYDVVLCSWESLPSLAVYHESSFVLHFRWRRVILEDASEVFCERSDKNVSFTNYSSSRDLLVNRIDALSWYLLDNFDALDTVRLGHYLVDLPYGNARLESMIPGDFDTRVYATTCMLRMAAVRIKPRIDDLRRRELHPVTWDNRESHAKCSTAYRQCMEAVCCSLLGSHRWKAGAIRALNFLKLLHTEGDDILCRDIGTFLAAVKCKSINPYGKELELGIQSYTQYAPVQALCECDADCTLCLEPFTEPVQTPCRHVFCLPCAQAAYAAVPLTQYSVPMFPCPLCKAIIAWNGMKQPRWTKDVQGVPSLTSVARPALMEVDSGGYASSTTRACNPIILEETGPNVLSFKRLLSTILTNHSQSPCSVLVLSTLSDELSENDQEESDHVTPDSTPRSQPRRILTHRDRNNYIQEWRKSNSQPITATQSNIVYMAAHLALTLPVPILNSFTDVILLDPYWSTFELYELELSVSTTCRLHMLYMLHQLDASVWLTQYLLFHYSRTFRQSGANASTKKPKGPHIERPLRSFMDTAWKTYRIRVSRKPTNADFPVPPELYKTLASRNSCSKKPRKEIKIKIRRLTMERRPLHPRAFDPGPAALSRGLL